MEISSAPAPAFAQLLPADVFSRSLAIAPAQGADRRRLEFEAGNACARAALSRLGFPDRDVARDADRVPVWPPGATGSITHCIDFAAAAVGRSARYAGLGIDAEPLGRIAESLARRVALPVELTRERQAFGSMAEFLGVLWCAKEALYKCLFPRHRVFFEFRDVELRFDTAERRFGAAAATELGRRISMAAVNGRYTLTAHHVLAVCVQERG